MPIVGNIIGGGSGAPKSIIFQTEDGEEMVAVLVGSEVIFDAGANDIREGKIAANGNGVVTGTKVIPAYHTVQGIRGIPAGNAMTIPNAKADVDIYDYTKLQAITCIFNTSLNNSVAAEHVCIDDNVYPVQSVESVSAITKNHESKIVDLGITNESDTMKIVRFFMYKEIE